VLAYPVWGPFAVGSEPAATVAVAAGTGSASAEPDIGATAIAVGTAAASIQKTVFCVLLAVAEVTRGQIVAIEQAHWTAFSAIPASWPVATSTSSWSVTCCRDYERNTEVGLPATPEVMPAAIPKD